MTFSICEQTLNPRPDQEEERSKSCAILDERGVAVRFEEEDEELEEILEVGVEEPLCYPYLAGQDSPLVLEKRRSCLRNEFIENRPGC